MTNDETQRRFSTQRCEEEDREEPLCPSPLIPLPEGEGESIRKSVVRPGVIGLANTLMVWIGATGIFGQKWSVLDSSRQKGKRHEFHAWARIAGEPMIEIESKGKS